MKDRKVAIIHDWLLGLRGGERVLDALCELYPSADLFTLFHEPGAVGPVIGRHPIQASFLNRFPEVSRYYRWLLPLYPLAIERFDLTPYDLVISSSHCVAKGIIPRPDAVHVCYCHTPMRYAWDRYGDYFPGAKGALVAPFLHYLRLWDVTSAARVDHFVANSTWVRDRIEKYYRRDADVIPPFVDLETFRPAPETARGDYYLVVSALAPYKRIDLAIRACNALDRELRIVGEGQLDRELRALAGPRTRFLGRVALDEVKRQYAGARALLFPGEEDFGITPLEAMACGKPVIALGRGGALDSVVDGETGLFFPEPTVESLTDAIRRFESGAAFSPARCRERAERFGRETFLARFRETVDRITAARRG